MSCCGPQLQGEDRRRRVDILLHGARVAVFVDGCFWHSCPEHSQLPKTYTNWLRLMFRGIARRDGLARTGSPRLRALLAGAEAALECDPEPCFRTALGPGTAAWPFERARAHLEFAEWLRRRRIAAVREPLTEAVAEFRRLGARPWVRWAETELRAAGGAPAPVPPPTAGTTTSPSGVTELSPQQQEIVRLAARRLTNREIGARLHLSPRTSTGRSRCSGYRAGASCGSCCRRTSEQLVVRICTCVPEPGPS
jgi:hypothetical protein